MRCSVGVATYPEDATDRAELLLAADRALYAAKRAGRDRVSTAADGLALAAEFVPPRTPVDERGTAGVGLATLGRATGISDALAGPAAAPGAAAEASMGPAAPPR